VAGLLDIGGGAAIESATFLAIGASETAPFSTKAC
jgi:hypothetical protein